MISRFLVVGGLAAALLLAAAAPSRAGAQDLAVERRGAPVVEAQPGGSVTLPFRLVNRSRTNAELDLRVDAPAGFRVLLPSPQRTVAAGAEDLALVALRILETAPAGRHAVRLAAAGRPAAADSAWVEVAARRAVQATVSAGPAMVVAGEPYIVRFTIHNAGNVAERLAFAAAGDRGAAPSPAAGTLVLAPGAWSVVELAVPTHALGPVHARHQVTFRVRAEDGGAVEAVARSLVEVVPRGSAAVRRQPGMPAEVRFRSSAGGVGFAFEGGTRPGAPGPRIAFRARSADAPGTVFGREDEYFLSVRTRAAELRAGDGVYRLSALSGPARRQAGGEISVGLGPLRAGGFVAGDRRQGWSAEEAGAFLRAGGERAGLGLTYEGGPSAPASGTSVEAWLTPTPLLRFRGELGVDPLVPGQPRPRFVRLSGAGSGLWYEVQHLRPRAGAEFGQALDVVAGARRGRWLAVSGGYRQGGWPDADTAWTTAGPRMQGRARVDLFRFLELEARTGREPAVGGPMRSQARRVGVNLRMGPLRLTPALEQGESWSETAPERRPYRAAELRGGLFVRQMAVTASLRREDGAIAGASPGTSRWTGALHGSLSRPGWRVRANLSAVLPDSGAGPEGHADVALERDLFRGHSLELRAFAIRQPGRTEPPRLQLEYRIPLAVPFAPAAATPAVSVRVVDVGTGRPVPGALVRVAGRTALTDRRGVAALTGVPGGQQPLRVERADAGPAWITRSGGPATVEVPASGTSSAVVEVAHGGALSGRVLRSREDASGPAEPLPGVEVLLSGDGGERRVTTDAEGRFRFEGLWPGWWRFSFVAASLPRHHAPKEATAQFLIHSGHEQTGANFEVVERRRPVRMMDGGELTPTDREP